MTDATRQSKRRRFDRNHQIEAIQSTAPHVQPSLPTVVFNGTLRLPEGINRHGGITPVDDVVALASVDSGSGDRLGVHESSECCYGMLCNIPTRLSGDLCSRSKIIPVDFHRPNRLSSKLNDDPIAFDILCPLSARILAEWESLADVQTQLYCHSKLEFSPEQSTRRVGRRRGKASQAWFLNIIIFGPGGLEDMTGAYLSRFKMYLQDPLGCERCVPYRNPHIFPPDSGDDVMTDVFDFPLGDLDIERLEAGPDLLAQLMEDDMPLPETKAPDIVKTHLFLHQKQALTFMMRREQGWSLEDGARDIWSRQRDNSGHFRYVSNVSGFITEEAPPDFRGGLLADNMGLGKTLSMLSLIAASQATADPPSSRNSGSMTPPALKATLIIVPPPLIQAWEKQISLHLFSGSFAVHVYHGQKRTGVELLGNYDIIITTYHTVSAIWRKEEGQSANEKSIFSVNWYRVILDEAHTIQNPRSQLARACCALHSTRRWAVTGTPIQNKLADFASILKFLRVHPYADEKTFEEEILRPWQNRNNTNAEGFLRLKTLVRAITVSRTMTVLELPTRTDEVHHLNFTSAEREKYEATNAQSRALLEEAICSGNQSGKTLNALSLLNILRLICNHGLLAQSAVERETIRPQHSSGGRTLGDLLTSLDDDVLGGTSYCSSCGANVLEDILEGPVSGLESRIQRPGGDQIICDLCVSQMTIEKQLDPSFLAGKDKSTASATAVPATGSDAAHLIESMSTKIKALVTDLYKYNSTEKSVVFSCWTKTLDFVQLMLNDKGILYTRIDGMTSLLHRDEALHAFQRDDSVRVILISITCGGAGLDLTAGSRVYLLEPQWNPMIEEQALCRVHRVGQKRNVTTIRYLMRDSFEEQIVDIQKRKKMLAQVTFAQGSLSEEGIGLGTLQYLKSVLK